MERMQPLKKVALSALWLLLAHLDFAKSQNATTADIADAYFNMAQQSTFHKINYYSDSSCGSLARSVWLMNNTCTGFDNLHRVLVNFTNGDSQAWYTEGVGAWVGSSCVSSWTAAFNISLSSGSCISASSATLSTATYSKFLGGSCDGFGCGFQSMQFVAAKDFDDFEAYTPTDPSFQYGSTAIHCLNPPLSGSSLEFEVPASTCVPKSYTQDTINSGQLVYAKYSCDDLNVKWQYFTDSACSSPLAAGHQQFLSCYSANFSSMTYVGCGQKVFQIPGLGTVRDAPDNRAYVWGFLFPVCTLLMAASFFLIFKRFQKEDRDSKQAVDEMLGSTARELLEHAEAHGAEPEKFCNTSFRCRPILMDMVYDRVRSNILLFITTLFAFILLFAVVAQWQSKIGSIDSFELLGWACLCAFIIFAPLFAPLVWNQHPISLLLSLAAYLTWACFAIWDCNGWAGSMTGYDCSEGMGRAFYTSFYFVSALSVGATMAVIFTETRWGVGIQTREKKNLIKALLHTQRKMAKVDLSKVGTLDAAAEDGAADRTLCQKLRGCQQTVWEFFYPEPEEFIVVPTRLIITAACQVIMLIIVNIFYVTQLCPWVEGSMTWPLINENSDDYDLYSCKTAMILSDVAGLSPEAFCPGTYDVNAGSLDQACRCTYPSGFSDNAVQSTHAAFAVPLVVSNVICFTQILTNWRSYRQLVLKLRRGELAFQFKTPLVAVIQTCGYLIANVVFIWALAAVLLLLVVVPIGNNVVRVFLWDTFGGLLLNILYFKLFDMIVIQTILVGMILTDGQAIRGERDGAAHLFYALIDFVYLFFSIVNGALNSIIRVLVMVLFSMIGPIMPGICTYPGFTSSFDSAYQAFYSMAIMAEATHNPIVIVSVEIFRSFGRRSAVEANQDFSLDFECSATLGVDNRQVNSRRSRQLAFRWQLYVLLHCNKDLCKYRKREADVANKREKNGMVNRMDIQGTAGGLGGDPNVTIGLLDKADVGIAQQPNPTADHMAVELSIFSQEAIGSEDTQEAIRPGNVTKEDTQF